MTSRSSHARFLPTSWTLVGRVAGDESSDRTNALEELAGLYWRPVYAFLRRRGNAPEEAADLTQGFFAHLLERDLLERADREKGRFRSYLLALLEGFTRNEARRRRAAMRAPDFAPSIDPSAVEAGLAGADTDPSQAFDRQWALDVLGRALARLAAEMGDERFAVVRKHLVPAGRAPSYSDSADALGMTEAAFTSALHRARRRLAEHVRSEVGEGLGDLVDALR